MCAFRQPDGKQIERCVIASFRAAENMGSVSKPSSVRHRFNIIILQKKPRHFEPRRKFRMCRNADRGQGLQPA